MYRRPVRHFAFSRLFVRSGDADCSPHPLPSLFLDPLIGRLLSQDGVAQEVRLEPWGVLDSSPGRGHSGNGFHERAHGRQDKSQVQVRRIYRPKIRRANAESRSDNGITITPDDSQHPDTPPEMKLESYHTGLSLATLSDSDEPAELDPSLRRVSDKLPWSAFLIAFVELCERFTYYGLAGPLQNYISNKYKDDNGLPGAIGLYQSGATALTNLVCLLFYASA